MSTAESSWTNRSSSIFCSSSAIGCSKSRKLVFTYMGEAGMPNDTSRTVTPDAADWGQRSGIHNRIRRMLDEQQSRLAHLLSRSALGDRAAFADLYGATRSKLFGVSLRIVRERSVAEEVLQDSFV